MPKGQQNCWCHLPGRKRGCETACWSTAQLIGKTRLKYGFAMDTSNCSGLFDKHGCIFVELSRPVSCSFIVGINALTKQVQWLHQLKRWHMTPPCVSSSRFIPPAKLPLLDPFLELHHLHCFQLSTRYWHTTLRLEQTWPILNSYKQKGSRQLLKQQAHAGRMGVDFSSNVEI